MDKVLLRHFSKDQPYRYNINQSHECLLHDIRGDYDEIREEDIEEMEADFYYDCTNTEVLMCCSIYALTELIGTLLVHANNGNELATKHLEEASKELEWLPLDEFLPTSKQYFEEFGATALNVQVHNQCVWLKNPSDAAIFLWDSGL
jgi:hypothetical protein